MSGIKKGVLLRGCVYAYFSYARILPKILTKLMGIILLLYCRIILLDHFSSMPTPSVASLYNYYSPHIVVVLLPPVAKSSIVRGTDGQMALGDIGSQTCLPYEMSRNLSRQQRTRVRSRWPEKAGNRRTEGESGLESTSISIS